MQQKIIVFSVFIIVLISSLYAQESVLEMTMNDNIKQSSFDDSNIKKNNINLLSGWSAGLHFGMTKFKGDVTQYDYYPGYQQQGNFHELRTAISFYLQKRVNSLYSLAIEVSSGDFAGLRRENEYLGFEVYDSYNNYDGQGDKFISSFKEIDVLVNINLNNGISYFSNSRKANKIYLNGKLGFGYNVFNTVRRNLFSDTYIYSFGYVDEGANYTGTDYGSQTKPFLEQTKESVFLYGLRVYYNLNNKIELHLDYTVRNAMGDKWDASIMSTQNQSDNFAFLSIGGSYNIGSHNYSNDWTSPLDLLKDNVSSLNVRIEGFTDDIDNDGVADAFDKSPNTPIGVAVDGSGEPLDVDMDNIPDYRDVDPFSNRGALVDDNGVAVSYTHLTLPTKRIV